MTTEAEQQYDDMLATVESFEYDNFCCLIIPHKAYQFCNKFFGSKLLVNKHNQIFCNRLAICKHHTCNQSNVMASDWKRLMLNVFYTVSTYITRI